MGVNGPEVETQYYSLVGVWRQLSHHQGSKDDSSHHQGPKDDSSHHQGPKDDRPVYTEPITPRTIACHASPSPSEPPWTQNTHLLDTMLFVNRCSTYEHKSHFILYTLTPIYSYGFSSSTSCTWFGLFSVSSCVGSAMIYGLSPSTSFTWSMAFYCVSSCVGSSFIRLAMLPPVWCQHSQSWKYKNNIKTFF